MKRKKGFTLVELLATLVVLSIILGIAIPKIGDMVKESRKRAFFTDSKSIIRQIQYKNQEFSSENLANLDLGGINVEGINLNESNAYFDNDTIFLDLVGKDKYEGMYLCGVTASSINDKVRSVPCDDTIVALTVLLNDGKTTQKFESTYPSNSNLTLLDPTKEDYKFFGWEVVSGDATVNNKTITFGSKNTTIYAKWGKVILLSTDLNGGTIERNFSGEYQTYDNVELLVPTKTGYSFNKWNLESGNSIISGNKIMIGTKDTSIKALYGLNTYIIGYTLNNGTLSATNPTSYTFESNTITLNNPTRNGYTFAGWTGSNGSTKQTTVTIPKGSTGDKSYTANYTPITYTISYTLNGGSATNPTSYNIETNTITLNNPTKTAYTFAGWTGSNGSTKQTTVTIPKGSTGNKNYTANYTPTAYTIGYTLNGGSATNPTSYTIETNTITLNNPTKNGYTFAGWTGSNGSTKKITVTIPKGSTGNKNYTANYNVVPYTIGYTLNGGSATNPTSYNIETNTITLNNPTRNGYTFAGWTGSNGSTKQTTVTIPKGSTGNKNYTANYDVVPYTISYTLNGGSATNPTSYNIETNTITLNNPTKNGYTFAGWTGSNGSTKQTTVTIPKGSTGNKDYTANYYQNNYQNTTTNAYFEKLSDAFNACANNQVIKVLNNTTEIVQPTAKAGITTKLDLNGKTITLNNVTLVNAGTLEIYSSVAGGIIQGNANDLIQNNASCTLTTNSSSTNAITIRNTKTSYGGSVLLNNGTATLNSNTTLTFNNDATGTESDRYVIINNKALTVNGATITSTAATAVKGGHGIAANAAGATTTISSGTVNTTGDSIHNKLGTMTITTVSAHSTKGFSLFSGTTGSTATPTMTINNGTFTSDVRSCLGLEAGTVTVNNGSLSSAGACVVWARNSTVNIKGGTYTENVNANIAAIAINEGATGNISGGTFNCPYNTTIAGAVASNSVLNITGGTYKLTGKYPVLGINGGTLNITGGTFENTNAEGAVLVAGGGTTNIKGGTIKSAYLPVYIANSATVNIGTNDGSVSTTNPTIISTKSGGVGIAVNSGTWNFYDGRIYAAYVGTKANSGVASGKSLKSASDNTYMSGGKRFYLG